MAIKNIIAGGVGFSPGSTKFIPTRGFISGAVSVTHQALKALVLEIMTGLGMTLTFNGNTLPISILTATPTATPPGNKGVCFKVIGGTVTIYVWDGSAWRAK